MARRRSPVENSVVEKVQVATYTRSHRDVVSTPHAVASHLLVVEGAVHHLRPEESFGMIVYGCHQSLAQKRTWMATQHLFRHFFLSHP